MMHIGIAGPLSTRMLADHLEGPLDSAPEGLGGISVTLLVRGLLAAGCRVSGYTLDQEITRPVVRKGPQLTVFYGPYRPRHRMRDFMRQERICIQHFIQIDRPDLIHAHWTYEFALGALSSRWPTLITVRDWASTILRLSPDPYRIGRWLMNAATLFKGRHFIANSPYIQQRLQRYISGEVPVIPNALDDRLFTAPKPRPPAEAPTIVSINSGFGQCKNVSALLQAFPAIRAKVPGCRLRLIGAGFEPGGVAERWAISQGLTRGVTFLGPMLHAAALDEIAAADLLVHPSLEESFGMTLLEAMAKGTPVVAGARSGAVPWVLNEGRAGILTDVTAPQKLAAAVNHLLTEPGRWAQFSEAGFAHAWDCFRLSKVADLHIDRYEKLASVPEQKVFSYECVARAE